MLSNWPSLGCAGRSGGRVGSRRLAAEGVQEHPGSQASCQDVDPFVVPLWGWALGSLGLRVDPCGGTLPPREGGEASL